MRLGLVLPPRASDLVAVAQEAERIGFDSLWVTDTLNRGAMRADPLVALGVAAAVTERVALGSCVVQAPLRPPFVLANQAGSVAALAGGRLTLGLGAGSTPGDFAAAGPGARGANRCGALPGRSPPRSLAPFRCASPG